jgi:hypothetical protein
LKAAAASNRSHTREAIDAYLWVDDADALYNEQQQSAADIIMPPTLRIYAMKEIEVRDFDGYVLRFGQDVPPAG